MRISVRRKRCVFRILVMAMISVFCAQTLAFGRPLGQDYYTVDQYPDIQALLKSVERAHLSNVPVWISKRGYGYALEELDYTLATFPNHPEALQLLLLYAKTARKPAVAIPYFDTAVRLYPQYAETHFIYGVFLTEFDMLKEGIRSFERALEIEPRMAVAHAWIAKAYDKAGDDKMARESAQKAIESGYQGNLLGNILKKKP